MDIFCAGVWFLLTHKMLLKRKGEGGAQNCVGAVRLWLFLLRKSPIYTKSQRRKHRLTCTIWSKISWRVVCSALAAWSSLCCVPVAVRFSLELTIVFSWQVLRGCCVVIEYTYVLPISAWVWFFPLSWPPFDFCFHQEMLVLKFWKGWQLCVARSNGPL